MLVAARDAGVAKVVHTSSSAVFGIPEHNPVTEDTPCRPLEAYGRAKLQAELLCHDAVAAGLDVTIVRPRTILGHGRLGIMAILFEFVADGAPVFVLGGGDNRYQFVHADRPRRRVPARRRTGPVPRSTTSARLEFGTMRETLQALVDHAGTGSRVRSLPVAPARARDACAARRSGSVPFAPYHWLLYSESLWFDVDEGARPSSTGSRVHSNASMLIESYEWFLAHRDDVGAGIEVASPVARPARCAPVRQAAAVTARRDGACPGPRATCG